MKRSKLTLLNQKVTKRHWRWEGYILRKPVYGIIRKYFSETHKVKEKQADLKIQGEEN